MAWAAISVKIKVRFMWKCTKALKEEICNSSRVRFLYSLSNKNRISKIKSLPNSAQCSSRFPKLLMIGSPLFHKYGV